MVKRKVLKKQHLKKKRKRKRKFQKKARNIRKEVKVQSSF